MQAVPCSKGNNGISTIFHLREHIQVRDTSSGRVLLWNICL